LCVLAVVQAWLSLKLNRALRGEYAGRWPELGPVGVFFSGSVRDPCAKLRWLYRKDYASADHPEFMKLCDTIRVSTTIYLGALIAMIALLLSKFT
jgi:hypothetical protein